MSIEESNASEIRRAMLERFLRLVEQRRKWQDYRRKHLMRSPRVRLPTEPNEKGMFAGLF